MDSANTVFDILAALFPRETGVRDRVLEHGDCGVAPTVPSYRPPLSGSACGPALGAAGISTQGVKKKKYLPPGAGAGVCPASAPCCLSTLDSGLVKAGCRAYWPAYNSSGCPVPAGSLPTVQLVVASRGAAQDPKPIVNAGRPPESPPSPEPPPVSAFAHAGVGCADSLPEGLPPWVADGGCSAKLGRLSEGSSHVSAANGRKGSGAPPGDGDYEIKTLAFLVDMFNTVEADLVADVLRACQSNCEAAIASLMDLQARARPPCFGPWCWKAPCLSAAKTLLVCSAGVGGPECAGAWKQACHACVATCFCEKVFARCCPIARTGVSC